MSVLDPDDRSRRLSARTAYTLLHVGEALREEQAEAARQEGLSLSQAQLLTLIATGDPEASTVTGLARSTQTSPPTISDSVRSLVRRGLIHREPSPRDSRMAFFRCTDIGSEVAARLQRWTAPVEEELAAFGSSRQSPFLSVLTRLLRHKVETSGFRPTDRMCASCVHFEPSWEVPRYHCAALERDLTAEELRLDCRLHEQLPAASGGAI